MALREILAKFGFDYDKSKLAEINSKVDATSSTLKTVVTTLVGGAVVHGIASFIEGIEHAGSSIKDLEESTGQTAETIQLFRFGAGQAGVESEEWDAVTRKLALSLGKAGDGAKEQAAALAYLKISTKDANGETRSLNDILPDIVDGFGDISDPTKKAQLAVDLFGRSGTKLVGFLSSGSEGLQKLREDFEELGGGFSEETVAAADEYGDNLKRLELSATSLKNALGNELLPVLTSIVRFVIRVSNAVREFSKHTELAKAAMISLGIVGAAGLVALLAPFAPIIAAVTALTLGLDDLVNFLEGNDSVIGDALNKFMGPGGAEKVRNYLDTISKEVETFFQDLIKHPTKFFDDLAKLIDDKVNEIPILGELNKLLGTTPIVPGDVSYGAAGMKQPQGQGPTLDLVDTISKSISGFGSANAGKLASGAGQGATQEDWFSRLSTSLFGSSTPQAAIANVPAALPSTAPVPGQAMNQIDQQNKVTINVLPSTPEQEARDIEKAATNALGNERRAALASLEQVSR